MVFVIYKNGMISIHEGRDTHINTIDTIKTIN